MGKRSFSGKQYWITGAGSGIGRELALQLAEAGARVYVSGRRVDALDSLAALRPGQIIPLVADVTDPQSLHKVMLEIAGAPAWLDGTILAAGICEYIDLPDLAPQCIRQVMEVNFHGVVNAVQAALPLLQAARQRDPATLPELVGIGSMSSYIGFPRAQAYGSSKAAMAYFLDALRCDLGAQLTVTVVYPGFVETPLTANNDFPMPFLMSAHSAATHIIRSLGKGKRTLSFPWQLHCLLTVARWFPALWYKQIIPKLVRNGGAGA